MKTLLQKKIIEQGYNCISLGFACKCAESTISQILTERRQGSLEIWTRMLDALGVPDAERWAYFVTSDGNVPVKKKVRSKQHGRKAKKNYSKTKNCS